MDSILPRGFPEELYKKTLPKEKTAWVCVRCGESFRDPEPHGSSSMLERRVSDLCSTCREQILYLCLSRDQEPKNLRGRATGPIHQDGGE